MIPRPPRSTRTDTLFPYTTLFRSPDNCIHGTANDCWRIWRSRASFMDRHGLYVGDDNRHTALREARRFVWTQDRPAGRNRPVSHWAGAVWPASFNGSVDRRSEERRVGEEGVSTFRSRWSTDHSNKNNIT